jgi:hypothetical protein
VPFDHVIAGARLSDLKSELEQFAMDARLYPKRVINAHPLDQCAQFQLDLRSPPSGRDLRRQKQRKPARFQRTSVSGRMIVRTCRIDGND